MSQYKIGTESVLQTETFIFKSFFTFKDFHVQSENNSSISESSSSSEADEVQYESRVPLPVQTINSSDDVICLDSD